MPDAHDIVARPGPVRPDSIEFFFDPMCPWAYQASLWIREVRDRTGLDIRWRFFSLEEINLVEGRPHPWEREWAYGWSQMRIGAWLRRTGQSDVDRWYEVVGRAFFVDGRPTQQPDVHREVLVEAGFEASVLDDALADPTTSEEVKADHDRVVSTHGAFGVPTLVFPDGNAIFGPVVVPAPTGRAAERLWDLVVGYNEFPQLYELRHPKTSDDLRSIAGAFEPYLRARSWKTVANPAL